MFGSIASANATFCATLVDQWIRDGLTAAFLSPGSRSTPLALAFADRTEIRVELFHDERAAAFAALGHGLATGRPAAVICTSGTAAAHFHAAVIEADLSAVPLLVCTADRPPELWGRGAPQTIDQTRLFGATVRQFVEPGPPDEGDPGTWRTLAHEAWQSAVALPPGPVHLNLSFREPLAGTPETLPPPLPVAAASESSTVDQHTVADIAKRVHGRRGVIIAGRGDSDPQALCQLAERLGWPLLADHRSGCRQVDHRAVVSRFDSLLRHAPFAERMRPDVVLRFGEIVSSKAVSLWLRSFDADVLTGRPQTRHIDPEDLSDLSFDEAGIADALATGLSDDARSSDEWLRDWRNADDAADEAISRLLDAERETNEIAIARQVLASGTPGATLVLASSMPVRDAEWFGPMSPLRVISNRGANGIDGTIATAIGIAATGSPTTVVIGDVALLHDSTALVGLRARRLDLTIVCIDNDGGGIFSFLPQHTLLDTERYEQLFGTPHGTDLLALARAHGLDAAPLAVDSDLTPRGVRLFVATTDRAQNLTLHDAAHAAVAASLENS